MNKSLPLPKLEEVKTVNGEQQLQALVDRKKIIITEATVRRDLQLEDVDGIDCLPNATIFEQLTLIGMVKNLDSAGKFLMYPRFVQIFLDNQLGGMINYNRFYIAPSHTKKVFANMKRQGKDFSGRVTPLKQRPRKLKRKDTKIPQSSVPVENVANEAVYKERDDSLERVITAATGLDAKQDKDITLENVHNADMFGVHDLDGDEVFVETEQPVVNAATTTSTIAVSAAKDLSDVDMTLAQVLAELKSTKPKAVTTTATTTTTDITRPKAKGLVIQEQEQASTPITSSKNKGKGIMVEEPLKMKKKYQILFDEQEAIRIQAQFDEEERIAREKEEEQEELIIKEKSKLFQQLLEKRRKHFAAKRAEKRRNRPPIKAQQRSIMCTYLKNMAGWKPKDLNTKSFANVQELFDKAMKRLAQEPSKKQKVDDDKETRELKQCMEIILDDGDDVTIEATPLSTKSPTIVDYKIYKEGKKSYFQIIRADGNSQMYLTFGKMLKNFDREDLEVLWSIVKARFKKTEPVNYMDIFLHLNLKTMFEHHLEDSVWKNQQGLVKVLNWKLYDSCGVHCVTMQNILYYLLVEKMYPLTKHTLHQMFNDVKLQVDYECEMAFELLRLVKKQLKEGYVPQ
ncbi:hypothetical protein Tco_0300915 [Tanacetum coccineum]